MASVTSMVPVTLAMVPVTLARPTSPGEGASAGPGVTVRQCRGRALDAPPSCRGEALDALAPCRAPKAPSWGWTGVEVWGGGWPGLE